MIVLVIKILALIFTLLNPDPHPHLESAFGMRIQETKIMRMRIRNTAKRALQELKNDVLQRGKNKECVWIKYRLLYISAMCLSILGTSPVSSGRVGYVHLSFLQFISDVFMHRLLKVWINFHYHRLVGNHGIKLSSAVSLEPTTWCSY